MSDRSSDWLSRRLVLAGLASAVGSGALARAPDATDRPKARGTPLEPVTPGAGDRLVREAGLGGTVGFAVSDAATGEILEQRLGATLLPPASTLKAVTAIYAIDRLGPGFRFRTEVLAAGPIENGRLDGDLILKGGGDPTLDTDRLAE